MVLFYHKTGRNSLKFVGFGKKNGGYNMNMAKLCVDVVFCKFYNMKSFLVRIYVVALMADNINGLLEAVDGFHVVFFAEKTACFVLCRKKSLIPLAFSRISGIIYGRVILHAVLAMGKSHRHLVHREVKERWQIMK